MNDIDLSRVLPPAKVVRLLDPVLRLHNTKFNKLLDMKDKTEYRVVEKDYSRSPLNILPTCGRSYICMSYFGNRILIMEISVNAKYSYREISSPIIPIQDRETIIRLTVTQPLIYMLYNNKWEALFMMNSFGISIVFNCNGFRINHGFNLKKGMHVSPKEINYVISKIPETLLLNHRHLFSKIFKGQNLRKKDDLPFSYRRGTVMKSHDAMRRILFMDNIRRRD